MVSEMTMKMIMVGGHTRNIGKTSVIEGIIRALPEMNWTAVKVTQFGHGVCSINGEACDCAVTEHRFSISEERKEDSGTDTARFLPPERGGHFGCAPDRANCLPRSPL